MPRREKEKTTAGKSAPKTTLRTKSGPSAQDGSPSSIQKASHRKKTASAGEAGRSGAARPGTRTVKPSVELSAPAAVVSRRACDRLRMGHVWVYQSDLEQVVAPLDDSGLLPVLDNRGIPMGTALYSPSSQIALRLISREILEDAQWLMLLRERLRIALFRRKPILARHDTDACRLVFSEADALPGLIIDKYGDLVILQLLTRGMDRAEVRAAIVEVLREELAPVTILERPDARIRELEELGAPSAEPLFSEDLRHPLSATLFHLNGLRFHYDSNSGQKTGAFLDQRQNYVAAAAHARGEALDVCCYQGGFALHLARVCSRVTGVDASRNALEVAEQNLQLNRELAEAGSVDWIEANAFDLLRDWSTAGPAYDTIVLDPPAFAKSKRAVEGAVRGYKELNLRAMKMLRPGGTLVTCSCSHHVSGEEFTAVVAAAAGDAGRRVRLIERRGASEDHPVQLTIPETEYLKCLICEVE
ncbi:MAG TPA: class I SAM-dependent rRNA methyltransferase [Acidisarcina sp.]|nr:class I SAM-dependent rRNA methyltransferase [Acidisarcina sp.]